ncbi:MYND finger protein [Rhizoctonia solani 123E]|uniref:MYND finger protein n=1 Tax=Rhizoctonia solani 123E TaxID=1423351 RepID=A0A074RKX5_9AGAM|nr:MYND finger protein [Rhizoctonia solani 123E]
MPRIHQVKARWGLPLDQYLAGFVQSQSVGHNISYLTHEGQNAITKICSLVDKVGDLKKTESAIAKSIILSDLHTVVKLAASPPHLHYFLRPPLISACIKLLALSIQSGLPSLFSHEYGFLTFRILTISVGVCIVDRTYGLGDAIESLTSESGSEAEHSQALSIHISRSLNIHIKDQTCDQMLGWMEPTAHTAVIPLVLPSEVAPALDLLFEDRKCFLKVFMHLSPVYVQGVLFLFWRYVVSQRSLSDHPSDLIAGSLYEILWRYFLIAPMDQLSVQIAAYHDIHGMLKAWSRGTEDHTLEDSRVLIQAFIQRFGLLDHSPIDIKTFINVQILVFPFLKPGCEDLAPLIFEAVVHQAWVALRDTSWNGGKDGFISDITTMFDHLSRLLDYLSATARTLRVTSEALTGIVNVMIQSDLLDFIQAMLFLLDPPLGKWLREPNPNPSSRFSATVTAFTIRLSRMIPKRTMANAFHDYTRNQHWYKFQHHMVCFGDPSTVDSKDRYIHHGQIEDFWLGIALTFCQGDSINFSLDHPFRCNYRRCGAPGQRGEIGPRFSCSRCSEIAYCNPRCQALDWSFDFGIGSHRQLCRGYVKQITMEEVRMHEILAGEKFKNLDGNYIQPVFDKHDGDLSKVIPELEKLALLPRHIPV